MEMMNNKQNLLNINKLINISNNRSMLNYVANIGTDILWGKLMHLLWVNMCAQWVILLLKTEYLIFPHRQWPRYLTELFGLNINLEDDIFVDKLYKYVSNIK